MGRLFSLPEITEAEQMPFIHYGTGPDVKEVKRERGNLYPRIMADSHPYECLIFQGTSGVRYF
jgi:hypothetical protein